MAEGIDLLDLDGEGLYFDEPSPPEVDALIAQAASHYGAEAEPFLLRAYFLAPEQLSVLVALYRYYFYQHRMKDALRVAERALEVTAGRLHLVDGWRGIGPVSLGEAVMRSIGLLKCWPPATWPPETAGNCGAHSDGPRNHRNLRELLGLPALVPEPGNPRGRATLHDRRGQMHRVRR